MALEGDHPAEAEREEDGNPASLLSYAAIQIINKIHAMRVGLSYDRRMKQFLLSAVLFLAPSFAFAAPAATLTVSQSAVTNTSIPLGAHRIAMATLTLKASCDGPVTVRTITVHHAGLGKLSDIEKIYLMDDTTRISRGAVLQSKTQSALLRPTGLVLKACASRTLTIAMDLSATASAGSEHTLFVESADDIQSTTSVILATEPTPTTPVRTTPSTQGSITYTEVPTSSRNVLFGKNRILLRFSLKADGNKDQAVDAITFTNDGSATDTDLQQLYLTTADGTIVSDVAASMDGELLRITFHPPLLVQKHATRLLLLHGNVTASRRRTIELTVEEPSDIEAHSATAAPRKTE